MGLIAEQGLLKGQAPEGVLEKCSEWGNSGMAELNKDVDEAKWVLPSFLIFHNPYNGRLA